MGKLTKLTNSKFMKGLTVLPLAATLAFGPTACTNTAGGVNNGKPNTEITDETNEEVDNEIVQNLPKFGGIFDRHRFAKPDDDIAGISDMDERLAVAGARWNDLAPFMLDKIKAFRTTIANEPGNLLEDAVNTELVNIENFYKSAYLDTTIAFQNEKFAKIMAKIGYEIYKLNDDGEYNGIDNYNRFMTCYDIIAAQAYNDSLGKNNGNANSQTNQEINSNDFKSRCESYGLQATDYDGAAKILNNYLKSITDENTSEQLLNQFLELALYKEGEWGLKDMAGDGAIVGANPSYHPAGTYQSVGERSKAAFESSVTSYFRILRQHDQQTSYTLDR